MAFKPFPVFAISIAVLGLLFIVLSGSDTKPSVPQYIQDERVDYGVAKEYWRSRIEQVGQVDAYGELLVAAKDISISQAHVLAHSFGEALFLEESISGISTCDDQLIWGCYHQFVGTALTEFGTSIVKDLDERCPADSSFSCRHGIGHGLVGFYGYDFEALKESLSFCTLLDAGPRNGCFDGVFMEYNLR